MDPISSNDLRMGRSTGRSSRLAAPRPYTVPRARSHCGHFNQIGKAGAKGEGGALAGNSRGARRPDFVIFQVE